MGVTNLPYGDLEELAAHLIGLGVRDHCAWRSAPRRMVRSQGARRLVHEHPHFAGAVMLTVRPRWVERARDSASPRDNFAWGVWSAPRARAIPGSGLAGREIEAHSALVDARIT